MDDDFAVSVRTKSVATLLQITANRLEAIELAIDNSLNRTLLVANRLASILDTNDAQTAMPKPDAMIVRNPSPLTIGTAVSQSARCSTQ